MPCDYTSGELAAARLLVHRLTCEFAEIEYDEDPAGISWSLRDSVIIFTDDEGRETTLGDLMYATISILVPLVATVASLDPDESVPLDIVQAIGIGVAQATEI
jgi:hypothetical protein